MRYASKEKKRISNLGGTKADVKRKKKTLEKEKSEENEKILRSRASTSRACETDELKEVRLACLRNGASTLRASETDEVSEQRLKEQREGQVW